MKRRERAIQDATKQAASVPLEVMEKAFEVLKLAKIVAEKGNVNTVSDAGVAALLAKAAIEGAGYNVKINLSSISDQDFVNQTKERFDRITAESVSFAEGIKKTVEEKL